MTRLEVGFMLTAALTLVTTLVFAGRGMVTAAGLVLIVGCLTMLGIAEVHSRR